MSPGDIAEWAGDMWIMKSAELGLAENLCFIKELSVVNALNMNFSNSSLLENDNTCFNTETCDNILPMTSLTCLDDLVSLLNNPQHDSFLNSKDLTSNTDFNPAENVLNVEAEHEFSEVRNAQTNRGENLYTNSLDTFNTDKVFSVLGVDLDLYFTNDSNFESVSDEDIDKLLDKNISYKNFECKEFSEKIEEFFNETFDCNFFGDTCLYENEAKQLTPPPSDTVQLLNMFPHISDENNKRRRSLLYERNCHNRQNQKEEKQVTEGCRPPRSRNYNPHPLINHDYTRKKLDEDKYFPCPIENCEKMYAKSSHLKAHLRRHSGEKPFVCNWQNCSWKFSRSDELARHKRSHSGIKPYKCEICDKAFARSDHLAKHKKVHRKKMAHFGSYVVKKRLRAKQ